MKLFSHTHSQLDHAEALCTPRPGLIPVYVSLAQTYKDDKQYTKALVYYRKEIDCRQDEPQQVKTLHFRSVKLVVMIYD